MNRTEVGVSCPYCGEHLVLLVEPSDLDNEYIEDCHVCCQPMVVSAWQDEHGEYQATTCRDDE
ncbi:MAG: CPXCG motif-containing cysteine-rich protein [Pseudomonadota bacterium]